MASDQERIAFLEAELRARDERLARLELFVVPAQLMRSYLHEAGHCISRLAASMDRLFTTVDRRQDARDERQRTIKAYENLRELHDAMVDLFVLQPRAKTLAQVVKAVRAEAPDQRVRTEIDDNAAIARVPEQLQLVLHQLIQNATESYAGNDHGDVLLRAAIENDRLLVSVTDRGMGISAKELHDLWRPGYTTKNRPGMGLAIVKHLVELWRGTTAIASSPGEGTTVTLSLPLHYDEHSVD